MAIRKNKKRIDPRYFLNETTYRDDLEETPDPEPDKYAHLDQRRRAAYKDYEPAYHDDVEVDHVKLAADIKSAMKTFTPEQVVDSIVRGLEHIGPAGEEALIALSGVFRDLGKPHHREHK
jgi:hypothetical protein